MNRYHTNTTDKVEDDRCRYKGSVVVWKSIMDHRRKGGIVGTRKSIIPRPQTGDRTCPASCVWQRKSLFGRQHQEGMALFGSLGDNGQKNKKKVVSVGVGECPTRG